MDQKQRHAALIKEEALRTGFQACGISRPAYLERDALFLRDWLDSKYHAGMGYMEKHFELRTDPLRLLKDAASIISVILLYDTRKTCHTEGRPRISKYAWGRDYHPVMKEMLFRLKGSLEKHLGPFSARVFVDSAPFLDRAWAARAGLGWIGKNCMLISRTFGSFVFIGEMITTLDLPADQPVPDHCGTCTRCMDACPTGALAAPRLLDSRRCISYHTIENRNEIDESLKGKTGDWIFGCDVCQEVCPWNQSDREHEIKDFRPAEGILQMSRSDWEGLSPEDFTRLFEGSALQRTGYQGIRRNLAFGFPGEKASAG